MNKISTIRDLINGHGSIAKDSKNNFSPTHWGILVLLMAYGYFANGCMNDGLNTYVGLFTEKFGWTSGQLLTYSTYAGWVSILIIIVYTQISKRMGARATAICAMSIAAFGVFLWGRVTTPTMYFVSILLLVSSSSAIMVIRDTTLANWFPTKIGLAIGWATMGPPIATATFLLLIGWAGKTFGFTGHFDIVGYGFIVLLLITVFWYRDNPEQKGCYPDNDKSITHEEVMRLHEEGLEYKRTSPWTTKKLLKTKQVWQIGVGVGGLNMLIGNAVMSQLIPTIMSKGFPRESAIFMMSCLAIMALPMSYWLGRLDTRYGTKRCIFIFFIWIFFACFLMVLPGGKINVYISVLMMGGMIGFSGNIMGAMTKTVFGRYDFSKAFSVIYPICIAVRSCAYALIGILRTITGGYTVPYIVLMVVAIIGMINILFLDDTLIGRNFIDREKERAKLID